MHLLSFVAPACRCDRNRGRRRTYAIWAGRAERRRVKAGERRVDHALADHSAVTRVGIVTVIGKPVPMR